MKKLIMFLVILIFMVGVTFSQENKIPLIGSKAPNFTAKTTDGKLKFPKDYKDNWKILFSHPQDFTPVCSSELLELAYKQDVFDSLNVKVVIISTDDIEQHNHWKSYLEELDYKNRGKQEIKFPIIDDSDIKISKQYGMLHTPVSTVKDVRGVFIIDYNNIIRSINFYPIEVGRNIDEILRTVVALQKTTESNVLTPANWVKGEDVMVPYYPYTKEQLEDNPELKDEYYNMGNRMWFKKAK